MNLNLSLVTKYFTPNRILDIGANTGQFHMFARQNFPNSYIYSIEAESTCEPELKQVTDQYYIGLLAKDNLEYDFYKLKSNEKCTGNSIYRELTEHYENASQYIIEKKKGVMLDDLLADKLPFDLIKIDTQGSELDIMAGGKIVCSKAKGILLEVSMTPCNENAPLFDTVSTYMHNIGFSFSETLATSIYKNFVQKDILFIKT